MLWNVDMSSAWFCCKREREQCAKNGCMHERHERDWTEKTFSEDPGDLGMCGRTNVGNGGCQQYHWTIEWLCVLLEL